MGDVIEPVPASSSARWALAVARADGAVPADYDFVSNDQRSVLRWRSPVEPGGYDEVEILADGHTFFRLDGKLHRLDGPAVMYVTRRSWFIHGHEYPDRPSWFLAATLALLGVPHLDDYIEAAIHADLSPFETAAGYRNGIPVAELRTDRNIVAQLP